MKEIKYRAWDVENKIMLPVGRIDFGLDGHGFRIFCNDGTNFWWIKDKKDFEIMQYTGLKDKKNKEIYEGDIVAFKRNKKNIKWVEKCKVENSDGLLEPFYINCFGDYDTQWDYLQEYGWHEIIGNIYETPELIK